MYRTHGQNKTSILFCQFFAKLFDDAMLETKLSSTSIKLFATEIQNLREITQL